MFDDAEGAFSMALQLTREAGDRSGQALAHLGLGMLYRRLDGRAGVEADFRATESG